MLNRPVADGVISSSPPVMSAVMTFLPRVMGLFYLTDLDNATTLVNDVEISDINHPVRTTTHVAAVSYRSLRPRYSVLEWLRKRVSSCIISVCRCARWRGFLRRSARSVVSNMVRRINMARTVLSRSVVVIVAERRPTNDATSCGVSVWRVHTVVLTRLKAGLRWLLPVSIVFEVVRS